MQRNQTRLLSVYCSLSYFASYITRLGFAAGLVEIISELQVEKSSASLATTGLFICYGLGQFLSGWLGDRVRPRILMLCGMIGSALCNLCIAFTTSLPVMVTVWCLNGLMQAFLWPPMTRLMAETLDEKGYMVANKWASVSASLGTIVVYALMSVFSGFHIWRGYFIFASVFGAAAAVLSYIRLGTARVINAPAARTEKKAEEAQPAGRPPLLTLILRSGLPMIMLAIIMQGMLRDGVTTWMPSLITDTTGLSKSSSILTTAILPVFSALSISLAAEIQKRCADDTLSACALFGLGALCSALILPLLSSCVPVVIILMAILTGCAHAINFLLICHVPSYFAKYGCVSTVSGVINSCTYVGSALSIYGIALISEKYGWYATVAGWIAIAAAGGVFCLLALKKWRAFNGIRTWHAGK